MDKLHAIIFVTTQAMKQFDIPSYYRSSLIGKVKEQRKLRDPRKRDFSPTLLDFGPVRFRIARHFGFCYGVENAIERSYKALEENPDKKIFLLSQMIHNPAVNDDLQSRGIRFIMDTEGNQFIPWEEIHSGDVVIVPAFGTTLEIEQILVEKGVDVAKYNTTCPFVEKVWKRAHQLGEEAHTVIIHGKHRHEETRATFSHSRSSAPALVIRDMGDAQFLADVILGKRSNSEFQERFEGRMSEGFDPERDLLRIGVVNQTTMLATETQSIADFLKQTMLEKYGEAEIKNHFADTRDTLCYATNDNQSATYALLEEFSDIAVVVGGYNSSNTSHLVELCERKMPTFFINGPDEIESADIIHHFNYEAHERMETKNWIPAKEPVTIVLTSGASCPDTIIDGVLEKILSFFPGARTPEEAIGEWMAMAD